jgi:transcriptional regulator with XRE-family HTH domain
MTVLGVAWAGFGPHVARSIQQCLELMGWTRRGAARRIGCDPGAVRQMANGRRPIHLSFGAWLEDLAAVHASLSSELRAIAEEMGCHPGEWVRYPRGIRPLSDEEAAALRRLAEAHAAAPHPPGWVKKQPGGNEGERAE